MLDYVSHHVEVEEVLEWEPEDSDAPLLALAVPRRMIRQRRVQCVAPSPGLSARDSAKHAKTVLPSLPAPVSPGEEAAIDDGSAEPATTVTPAPASPEEAAAIAQKEK